MDRAPVEHEPLILPSVSVEDDDAAQKTASALANPSTISVKSGEGSDTGLRGQSDSMNNSAEQSAPASGSSTGFESTRPSTRPRKFMQWLRWWGWEMGACICSLAVFFAIFGLLRAYDGKAQPHWLYGITINSATAWLSAIMKGLLLVPATACISQSSWLYYASGARNLGMLTVYDSASRGPWGSIQLLWALRARQLVCIGSLLMIFAIGIDPIVQQSITVRTRMVESKQEATVPRSEFYITNISIATTLPTRATLGGVYAGLFFAGGNATSDESMSIVPSCPTGNCTFPIFQSLAACSRCEDLSSAVERTCDKQLYSSWPRPETGEEPGDECQFSVPNGVFIRQTAVKIRGKDDVFEEYDSLNVWSEPPPEGWYSPDETMVKITTVRGRVGSDGSMPVNASLCSLYWCINTYNSSVMQGRLVEKTTDSEPMKQLQWWTNSSSMFLIGTETASSLRSWLRSNINFTFSNNMVSVHEKGVTGWRAASPTAELNGNRVSENLDLITLFRESDPQTIFENLARAMTAHIRQFKRDENVEKDWPPQDYGLTNEPVNGTASEVEAYIAIRWAWLAFPASMLVFTVLYFILVVVQTATSGVPVWKFSPLAMLYHRLEGSAVDQVQGITEVAEMEKHAKRTKVRLQGARLGVVSGVKNI